MAKSNNPFIILTIVSENQNKIEKAVEFGQKIKHQLDLVNTPKIEPYIKFDNSFKFSFDIELIQDEDPLIVMVNYANLLCSNWMLMKIEKDTYELVFNKTEQSEFENQNFNVIKWAHLRIEHVHCTERAAN